MTNASQHIPSLVSGSQKIQNDMHLAGFTGLLGRNGGSIINAIVCEVTHYSKESLVYSIALCKQSSNFRRCQALPLCMKHSSGLSIIVTN